MFKYYSIPLHISCINVEGLWELIHLEILG